MKTPREILEDAHATAAAMPPLVLPTQAYLSGHPSVLGGGTLRERVAELANEVFPREACGFVLSNGAVVRCTNTADDSYNAFEIDAEESQAWWSTGLVDAVWHSHPTGPSLPSERDEYMSPPQIPYLIFSVGDEDLAHYVKRDERLELTDMDSPE